VDHPACGVGREVDEQHGRAAIKPKLEATLKLTTAEVKKYSDRWPTFYDRVNTAIRTCVTPGPTCHASLSLAVPHERS
jgi:hypothetical protein